MQARLRADGNLTYGEKDRNEEVGTASKPSASSLLYITTTIH